MTLVMWVCRENMSNQTECASHMKPTYDTVDAIIAYSMAATLACYKPDNPPLQGIGL